VSAFSDLIDRQLVIAAQADPSRCSECGRHLERWYYGFPLPLCCFCVGRRLWGQCPDCGMTVRQTFGGSGVLTAHGPNGTPCPEHKPSKEA
jgi:hypothetical protein